MIYVFLCFFVSFSTILGAAVPGLVDPNSGKDFAANQDLSQTSIPDGSFAWRKQLKTNKMLPEEIFDNYVADLVFVAYPGYKALPPEALTDENKSKYEFFYKKQGNLVASPINSHFAIKGEGFFMVKDQNGQILFTRNGQFSPNAQGVLVNSEQHTLQPELVLDATAEVVVDATGALIQAIPGQTTGQAIYQFELFMPIASTSVEREGSAFKFNQYTAITVDADHKVYNKSLEMSTTEASKTLIEMTRILYNLKNNTAGNKDNNYDFRQYLVDFLLKEFSKAADNTASLENFGQLSETVAQNLSFKKKDDTPVVANDQIPQVQP
jgi:hypothetical protein